MSKLKITDVQVDCRNLTQDQVNKMCEIFEREGFFKSTVGPDITEHYHYVSTFNSSPTKKFGFYRMDEDYVTLTYDEFITLFDKPKFKPKKAIKELEQRVTLLEQKFSQKGAENGVNEMVNEPSKEDKNELVEGCVAKFWGDDEDEEFEVGIYERYTNLALPHRSKKSDIVYKNARRLSKEEVIDLLFTN